MKFRLNSAQSGPNEIFYPKGEFTGGYLVDPTPPDLSSNLPEEPPTPQKKQSPQKCPFLPTEGTFFKFFRLWRAFMLSLLRKSLSY